MPKNFTHTGLSDEVIRQKSWTERELRAMGYDYYERKKEVTLARVLPSEEAPLAIKTSKGDTLTAQAGYYICYTPGDTVQDSLADYRHWPVEPEIFKKTYKLWDEPNWQPTETEAHLLAAGCAAYYKAAGIWAKKLTETKYLQSLEHEEAVLVPSGEYIAIGADGEPYSMGEKTLLGRYMRRSGGVMKAIRKLLGLA